MEPVPETISFPRTEEKILEHWTKIDAFQTSLKRSEGKPEFSFYDGPPFATGLPHYGHILAGTIKDTVTRYAHQTGHHVTRRFGWDTHGLPIEFEIDKEYGVKTREDVLKMGIPKYNAACRSIVMRYSGEWEKIVTRLGRWIDFKDDYKTLDITFMESVWWVFWKLYEAGLVYCGYKVMPYSTGCTTPLSNFEAGLLYKDVPDPAVIVSFPLEEDPTTKLVAWTTTPWTLPSNLALCVNPEFNYVKLKDFATGEIYILSEGRIPELYPEPKKKKKGKDDKPKYEILATFKGETLKGKRYLPLFDYFSEEGQRRGAFRVLTDGYVTNESGTGVVHCAPGFGEDDYRVCLLGGIIQKDEEIPCPVDADGCFTEPVREFKGMYVKAADPEIIKHLKGTKRMVHVGSIIHSYPFCWRSETPLIYKAVPSWFVAVEKIKNDLVANNLQTYWVPGHVKEGRFHNWLQDARDWAVSRNRYWGTPIPIWQNPEKKDEIICVGSIQQLYELSGVRVTDLHRESIDHITIPSPSGHGVLRRVEEVFDCWFESGSMPYGQLHYPFENKELFEKSFPADFIAEGIDQTRGWFYTLMILSTALFNKPAFKNVVVNGLVLASDGKKMSKRLKNYPDPMIVVNTYGADALRLYLINSPVVRGEELRFVEKGVKDVLKDVFLPWYNAFRFLAQSIQHAKDGQFVPDEHMCLSSKNVMDKWILSLMHSLLKFVQEEMKAFRLYTVVPKLVDFIGQLTNWYIRFNRARLKGTHGKEERLFAANTLFHVILTLARAMAPFTPFFVEYLYLHLRNLLPPEQREDSVHYLSFPTFQPEFLNAEVEAATSYMQSVVELARAARDRRKMPLKYPLRDLTVVSPNTRLLDSIALFKPYILAELNLRELVITSNEATYVKTRAIPDKQRLGKRYRGDADKAFAAIAALSHEQLTEFRKTGKAEVLGQTLTTDDVKIIREFAGDSKQYEAVWTTEALVVLNLEVDQELRQQGFAREIVNKVQKLRKKAGLNVGDPVEVFVEVLEDKDELVEQVLPKYDDYLTRTLILPLLPVALKTPALEIIRSEEKVGSGSRIRLYITGLGCAVNEAAARKYKDDEKFVRALQLLVVTRDYQSLKQHLSTHGKLVVTLDDVVVELDLGRDIFLTAAELLAFQRGK
jgi:isoleucyl-tRNA synthetase